MPVFPIAARTRVYVCGYVFVRVNLSYYAKFCSVYHARCVCTRSTTIPYKLDLNSNETKRITLSMPSSAYFLTCCVLSLKDIMEKVCIATKVFTKQWIRTNYAYLIKCEVETLRGSLLLFIFHASIGMF